MGPMDYAHGGSMTTHVSTMAETEDRVRAACPGWDTWVIRTHDSRTEWSARPAGAVAAVIYGRTSPVELIARVRAYERDLPRYLDDARRQLAVLPDTGIGRDQAAVLRTLAAALEALQAKLAGQLAVG